jgi:predicted nuclease with TOPRIM domain
VPGLATWDDVGADCKSFSIFVGGLSNGWATTKDQVLRRKVLRLDFQRDKAGVMRFVPPTEWVYREAKEQPGEVKPKTDDERRAEKKELATRIDRLARIIVDCQSDLPALRTEVIQLDEALQRPGLTETERKNLTARRDERKEELEGNEKLLKTRLERLRQMQAREQELENQLLDPFRYY